MKTPHLVAMVNSWASPLGIWDSSKGATVSRDIELVIARLDTKDNTPRNYSHQYEEREDTAGGCKARLWGHQWGDDKPRTLLATHGPDITSGDLDDYERAVKGMRKMAKALAAMETQRGGSIDASESLGRWLEACGVTQVYSRPDGERNHGWLNKGEWRVESTGQFLYRVRMAMPENARATASVEGGVV
jgi:hypothetical protein